MKRWTPTRNASAVLRVSKSGSAALTIVDALRSMPEQNASPAPVTRSARTAESPRASWIRATISSRISTVSAFLASDGRG